MTSKEIMTNIGIGLVLCVPKDRMSSNEPCLFNPVSNTAQVTYLGWEDVDNFLKNLPSPIAMVEERDMHWQGGSKKGWKSMGWDGINNDYYRMVH